EPVALRPVVNLAEREPQKGTQDCGLGIRKRVKRHGAKMLTRMFIHEPTVCAEHKIEQGVMLPARAVELLNNDRQALFPVEIGFLYLPLRLDNEAFFRLHPLFDMVASGVEAREHLCDPIEIADAALD